METNHLAGEGNTEDDAKLFEGEDFFPRSHRATTAQLPLTGGGGPKLL